MCHLQHPGNGSEKSPGSCAACCCFSDWLSVSLSLRSCWSLLVLAGVSYPIPYRADQYCGTGLASNFCGWWSKEGAAEIRTNSAGFRDREHRLQKPEDVLRVAVLGDSYIEAFQVSQDEMFASVLEAELKSRKFGGDRRVEVLSFGVSDFGTAQELLMLRHHVWQFDPDVVLLAFLPANDLRNNSSQLESQRLRPVFEIVDDKLVLDLSFRTEPSYLYALSDSSRIKTSLVNSSRVLQLIQAVRRGELAARLGETKKRQVEVTIRDRVGLDDQCFKPPADAKWRHAWKLTERLIQEMELEVVAHGGRFAMAVVTSGIQVTPDEEKRKEYCEALGVSELDYADHRLSGLGDEFGFPVVVLSDRMRAYGKVNKIDLHGFENTLPGEGHWNSEGHLAAARICVEQLSRAWPRERQD